MYLKSYYFKFHLFSKILNKLTNKRWYYQTKLQNSHWQDMCRKKYYLLFLSNLVSSCCFDLLKKEHISNFNEISLKKREISFETLFSPSFDVPHSSPIVYMNHTELMFQDLLFLYCTKNVPENNNNFFHFCHRGETHFLVLAQTLICWKVTKSF